MGCEASSVGFRYSFSTQQDLIVDNSVSPIPWKEGLEQGNYHFKIYLPAFQGCSYEMTVCDCKGPVLLPKYDTNLKAHLVTKTP